MNSVTRWFLLILGSIALLACDDQPVNEALGTLERDRIVLRATAAELIVAEPVAEGSQVTAGTLLVQLDDRRQKANVARAEAELAMADAQLEKLRNGARPEDIAAARSVVDGARAGQVEAEKNYERSVQLVEQKLASQAVLDRALASRDSAESALETATKQLLVLTNGTRQEELDQGEAARNAALAQLDLQHHLLSELSISATRDSWLDSLPWHEGERVTSGSVVAVLLADETPHARVYVPEIWRARLTVGDEFPVKVDGIDNTLRGRLRWIATEPAFTPYYALNAKDRSRLVYLAEFSLLDGRDLPTGMPAQVILGDD